MLVPCSQSTALYCDRFLSELQDCPGPICIHCRFISTGLVLRSFYMPDLDSNASHHAGYPCLQLLPGWRTAGEAQLISQGFIILAKTCQVAVKLPHPSEYVKVGLFALWTNIYINIHTVRAECDIDTWICRRICMYMYNMLYVYVHVYVYVYVYD